VVCPHENLIYHRFAINSVIENCYSDPICNIIHIINVMFFMSYVICEFTSSSVYNCCDEIEWRFLSSHHCCTNDCENIVGGTEHSGITLPGLWVPLVLSRMSRKSTIDY
jgi:hypothetical protein